MKRARLSAVLLPSKNDVKLKRYQNGRQDKNQYPRSRGHHDEDHHGNDGFGSRKKKDIERGARRDVSAQKRGREYRRGS